MPELTQATHVEGAVLLPRPGAVLVKGSASFNAHIMKLERPLLEFVVHRAGSEILVDGQIFSVPLDGLYRLWTLHREAPERIEPPRWLRAGERIQYLGPQETSIQSSGPVRLSIPGGSAAFLVSHVGPTHFEFSLPNVEGTFQASLANLKGWSREQPRRTGPDWLTPGVYLRPLAEGGGPSLEAEAHRVSAVGDRTFTASPVGPYGALGTPCTWPLWNAESFWTIAPEDPSVRSIRPGDLVRGSDGEVRRVLRVEGDTFFLQIPRENYYKIDDPGFERVEEHAAPNASPSRYERVRALRHFPHWRALRYARRPHLLHSSSRREERLYNRWSDLLEIVRGRVSLPPSRTRLAPSGGARPLRRWRTRRVRRLGVGGGSLSVLRPQGLSTEGRRASIARSSRA
jgi:hypothetical protein